MEMPLTLCLLLLLLVEGIRCFCKKDELRCIDGKCVSINKLLNGVNDCLNGMYDEDFNHWCQASQMNCADGRCISRGKFQNGVNDCGDNSDEVQFPCTPPQYSCQGMPTVCIELSNINDGIVHCPDAADEVKHLYGSCGINNECNGNCTCNRFIEHSVCTNGTCVCDSGYKRSGNKKRCIARKLDDVCSIDIDCMDVINNSICYEERCQCGRGYISNGTITCRQVEMEDPCTEDMECLMFNTNSRCLSNTCDCALGFYNHNMTRECIPRHLNDICNITEDCSSVIDDSLCLNSTCLCAVGFYGNEYSNSCTKRKVFDGCIENEDCSTVINSSLCFQEVCVCEGNRKSNHRGTLCVQKVVGDECHFDLDCDLIENSLCANDICACQLGYNDHVTNTSCHRRRIFDQCDLDEDCSFAVNSSLCQDEDCECEVGMIGAENNTACRFRILGDTCSTSIDCSASIQYSECTNNTCTCVLGYNAAGNDSHCLLRKIGDATCFKNVDCDAAVIDSECTDNTCLCLPGYIDRYNGSICSRRNVSSPCDDNMDCIHAMPYSLCSNGTCACRSGFKPINSDTDCELRTLNDTCHVDNDCSDAVANSNCSYGQCSCNSGYMSFVVHSNLSQEDINPFLNATTYQQNSTDPGGNDTYSLRNHTGVFVNRSDAYRGEMDSVINDTNTSAEIVANLNETDEESFIALTASTGDESIATSKGGKGLALSVQCVIREIEDACIVHTDCSDAVADSICIAGQCTCRQGFKNGENKTICDANRINDVCGVNGDCNIPVNNSACANAKCKCTTGFQVNTEKTECNRRKIFDKTCHTSIDCFMAVPYSSCIKRQCMCNSGYYPTHGNATCTKFKIGDKNCVTILDCKEAVGRSSCRKGECTCINGYMADKNNTACKKRIIGDPCSKAVDCSAAVFRSFCNNGSCDCNGGYDANPKTRYATCVKTPKRLLDTCSFDEQCQRMDNLSSCGHLHGFASRITSCVCQLGFFARFDQVDHGQCYAPLQIGDYCEDRAWCQLGDNVQCVNKECICRSAYLPNATYNGCVHYPNAIGDLCRLDSHCLKINHSECFVSNQNNTCQCQYKYKSSEDRKECLPRPFAFTPPIPAIEIGLQCDVRSGKPCNRKDEGRKYWRCGKEEGRQHTRCLCVHGYASKYSADKFKCEEIQTYYFNIILTHELGCDKGEDTPLCYLYQPISVRKQYNNQKTRYFLYIRDRIVLQGFANMFNDTSPHIRDRYITSEVLNITGTATGMKVGVLVYLLADYYNIIDEAELEAEMIKSLIRSHGEIGSSQLKMSWSFDNAIEYKDFDECTEQGGRFSDCSPIAWCLNTRVSYMCSCRHGYEDWSPDSDRRPGRICTIPPDVTTDSLSCSDGKCENQWEYISLALVGFGFVLFIFIGYEIYTRKKKLEKSDIYYKLQKAARKAKIKAFRERRKSIKQRRKSEGKLKKNKHIQKNQVEEEQDESRSDTIEDGQEIELEEVVGENVRGTDEVEDEGEFVETVCES